MQRVKQSKNKGMSYCLLCLIFHVMSLCHVIIVIV